MGWLAAAVHKAIKPTKPQRKKHPMMEAPQNVPASVTRNADPTAPARLDLKASCGARISNHASNMGM